jgi:hypothetical protein
VDESGVHLKPRPPKRGTVSSSSSCQQKLFMSTCCVLSCGDSREQTPSWPQQNIILGEGDSDLMCTLSHVAEGGE